MTPDFIKETKFTPKILSESYPKKNEDSKFMEKIKDGKYSDAFGDKLVPNLSMNNIKSIFGIK